MHHRRLLQALARQLLVPALDAACADYVRRRLCGGNCLEHLRAAVRFALHDLHAECVALAAQGESARRCACGCAQDAAAPGSMGSRVGGGGTDCVRMACFSQRAAASAPQHPRLLCASSALCGLASVWFCVAVTMGFG